MPEVPYSTRGLAAVDRCRPPLGLSSSDCESSTISRERRRVALAAKVAVQELTREFRQYFEIMFDKLECLAGYMQENLDSRLSRLETLFVCSPNAGPSVDDVLSEMLSKQKHSPKPSLASCINFDVFSDDECLQSTSASGTSEGHIETTFTTGVWEPLPPEAVVQREEVEEITFGHVVAPIVGAAVESCQALLCSVADGSNGEMCSNMTGKTKLNSVSINDELRVRRQVHVADERLTLIVGERYKVLELGDACARLEFLDETMVEGRRLTLSVKRDDLACFECVIKGDCTVSASK